MSDQSITKSHRVNLPCSALAALLLVAGVREAAAAGDASAGEKIFQSQCAVCHSNQPGVTGLAPSLAGVVERKAASIPDFSYTSALKNSGLVWDPAELDQFLTDPAKKVPGTAMAVAISAAADRSNLIAYLATLTAAAPAAAKAAAVLAIIGPSQAELNGASTNSQDWLYVTHDYAGTRFVDLQQITPANAGSLRAVCLYRPEQQVAAVEPSPVVYKGVMYVTFGFATVAIDAATCRERWTYVWHPNGHVISPPNRGVAIKDGKLVRGTPDGFLIALDMASGELGWSKQIASAADNQYLSMPPLIWGDTIIYGPAGADYGSKSWIGAFRLADGAPVWRFNLVPDPGEPGADTWKNEEALTHGGGSLWTPLSLDQAAGILYVPVGNPAPDFFGAVRPGDDLYTNSLVALDLRTGKLLWYRQFVSHDVHDSDLSQV